MHASPGEPTLPTRTGPIMATARQVHVLMAALAAVVVVAGVAVGLLLTSAYSQIDGQQTQINQLQQQLHGDVVQIDGVLTGLRTQIGAATSQLKASSPFGNLISCSDLASYQRQLFMTGIDSLGGNITVSQQGSPWLPPHCLK